jgi:nickel-dependent lactate racemase
MRIAIRQGRREVELELAGHLVGRFTGPEPLRDPADSVREALEHPFSFPPLRRALTPGDRLALLVDENLPDLAGLLVPLLDHITSADVAAESITIICPTTTPQAWIDELPERHEEIHIEVHDPKDRRRLSYLATTSAGRRLYLNRAVVDADQLVVLSERRYDLRLGYGGGEGAVFPALADESALTAAKVLRTEVPGEKPWPLRQEAIEVSWLLGQPFHVQAIASRDGGVAHVIAGAADACRAAERLLDRSWRPKIPRRADTVIVSLTGDPSDHTFDDLARAVVSAARVVRPEGRIVLLADTAPDLGPARETLLRADEPRLALAALEESAQPGSAPAILWAQSAAHARLSVLGGWSDETTEELFATPLDNLAQVQRLASTGDVLVLEDAHRMMAVVE